MRKFFLAISILTLFASCSSNRRTEKSDCQTDLTYAGVSHDEREYLTKRDCYTNRLQSIQKKQSGVSDSLQMAGARALSELEVKLKKILKNSRFSDKGKINLETLLGFMNYGLLDGLFLEEDSLRICYTSKNLFAKYLHNDTEFDKLSTEVFEGIFMSAFQFDASVTNFSFIKIHSTESIKAYGMVAGLSQITGRFTPQFTYVLVLKGEFVYLAEKQLKEPVKEIPRCVSVWDSLVSIYAQPVDDAVFAKYCDCYREHLIHDSQFSAIRRQMESMVTYLEGY